MIGGAAARIVVGGHASGGCGCNSSGGGNDIRWCSVRRQLRNKSSIKPEMPA